MEPLSLIPCSLLEDMSWSSYLLTNLNKYVCIIISCSISFPHTHSKRGICKLNQIKELPNPMEYLSSPVQYIYFVILIIEITIIIIRSCVFFFIFYFFLGEESIIEVNQNWIALQIYPRANNLLVLVISSAKLVLVISPW